MSEKEARFIELLLEWNKIHNLTGAKTALEVEKNIEDSMFPTTFIEKPGSILDVGTGAGFPGLLLAMAYPDVRTVLCEPRKKRASFLKYVAMELELSNVEVVKKRVEEYSAKAFGLISSRAVTDTKMLLDLTAHLQDKNTQFLFYKGEQVFNELESVNETLDYDIIEKDQRNYLYIKGKK
ncbi:MAG: rRNA small subunit 7-methylguanosine (m7G) methyltransferase GidB [uncultured Sulfurovum sp.]|uniref:Ribosomal RNA small subunit methyltransferase G n=1 Tax=uncultured Sulfurovum sp. TaxID=269237 RepID=A0A6S6SIC0_9BACT|nr:MAG: rRNA small subunit 7-methylguanosine (m7G) methyltransferase GidB [uncultured Sulfurovum sp.]